MLREHDSLFRKLLIAADLIIVAAAFFISHTLRSSLSSIYGSNVLIQIYPLSTYLSLLPLVLALWAGCLYAAGAYQPLRGRGTFEVLSSILKACLLATFAFGSFAYLLKIHYVSRILITTFSIVALGLLSLERIAILRILRSIRKKGRNIRYLLIIGTGKRAQAFIDLVENHPEWGFKIQGLVDDEAGLLGQEIAGCKVLGMLRNLPGILEHMIVDEVVFIVPRTWLGKIEDSILYCEQVGKRVSIAIDLFTLQFANAKQSGLPGFPLLMFQSTSDKLLQLLIKRVLDGVLSAILLALFSPIFLLAGLIIKLNSPGPVLFRQTRCSLNGRTFTLYKFRTMVVHAEALLENLRHQNELSGPAFKMSRDPRVIPGGRWMRKFSIDELPQLWNVLKGDMSLIGPRPPIPAEVSRYEPWQRRRLSMRPGLTGLWQVEGRNKIIKFEEWMKLDLQYIDQWDLGFDFKIFLKTIPIVFFGIGAK